MVALNNQSGAQERDASSKLFDLSGRRVFVAGHRGLVGSAIVRRLAQLRCNLVTASRDRLDLLRQDDTEHFILSTKPDVVIVAAGKVGGIHANSTLPAEFIYENLVIATNLIHGAFRAGVRKVLFLGSSCIYPKLARQPVIEDELLTGPLEPTNEWYAVAKIAGVKLCQAYRRQYGADYISVMPTNVYGPGDNYHPENSHVMAALIRRFHEAKQSGSPTVTVWGTGTPRREFIFVDDLAEACVVVLEGYAGKSPLNIGTGEDITITDLARLIAEVTSYRGELVFDRSRPDGTPRKLLDISKLRALGWKAHTPLVIGLERSYADFLAQCSEQGVGKAAVKACD
jgi:GDP-L-fucose synthase